MPDYFLYSVSHPWNTIQQMMQLKQLKIFEHFMKSTTIIVFLYFFITTACALSPHNGYTHYPLQFTHFSSLGLTTQKEEHKRPSSYPIINVRHLTNMCSHSIEHQHNY